VAITPEANVAYLEAVLAKAKLGAQAAANAMAAHVADRVANDTLQRRRNPPGTWYKARPGDPPSYGTGTLAKSIYTTPASGGLRSSAFVGSQDKRARLFEFGGCVLKPGGGGLLHWKDSGGWWSHRWLRVDEKHPFLGPTTEDAVNDGSLQQAARDAFREYDP
jgi:hypothetical protein